jgi:hypothetical protein
MQFLKTKRLREVKTLKFILREAKKERKMLRENRAAQREYLVEAQRAINAYYAYALLERELRLFSEAASLVASEDATITFLLKNLAHSESNNEIGHYINDQFSDLIDAVETLNRNVGDQETGTVGKPAKFGGYGGGVPMGTAGIVRELFGQNDILTKPAATKISPVVTVQRTPIFLTILGTIGDTNIINNIIGKKRNEDSNVP